MFILPPPPKYYTNGVPHLPPLEASNTRTVLGEADDFGTPDGTYAAVDCVFVATPPPHPSDPAPLTVNPLAPRSHLPSMYSRGPRITIAPNSHGGHSIGNVSRSGGIGIGGGNHSNSSNVGQSVGSPLLSTSSSSRFGWNLFKDRRESAASPPPPLPPFLEKPALSVDTEKTNSGSYSKGGAGGLSTSLSRSHRAHLNVLGSPTIASNNVNALATALSLLNLNAPQSKKAVKPKSNMSKSNSSFVSRSIVHDNFNRRFNEKIPSDDVLVWTNVGRSLNWLTFPADTSSTASATKHEPLTKLLLTKAHPLCHDINLVTKSFSNMEVVLGTSAGDILWTDMVTNKYNRINKNGEVSSGAVVDIKWVPRSENFFVSAHADGHIFIWDKEREEINPACGKESRQAQSIAFQQQQLSPGDFRVDLSFEATGAANNKQNPVASYKVCNGPISSMEFAPDGSRVCVTTNDGLLKVIDLSTETLLDVFPSYFGGVTCAAFSPDGKYLASGGQDDTISIFCMATFNPSLVARLEGHTSWVSAVKFDPYNCDGENYRLGSTGEDGKLMLWDFSPRTLTTSHARPKTSSMITTKTLPALLNEKSSEQASSGTDTPQTTLAETSQEHFIVHPFRSYYDAPMLRPVGIKLVKLQQAESESLSDIVFLDNYIMVASKDSRIWSWRRP